jgi:4a-hydroxytetrahydrobiopterin dehydratase
MSEPLAKRRCAQCEDKNIPPMEESAAKELMKELGSGWLLVDGGKLLAKSFKFKNFVQTMEFVNKIAAIAEEQGHHPDMTVGYNTLGVELMTHAIGGLSENDFIVAAKIDEIGK